MSVRGVLPGVVDRFLMAAVDLVAVVGLAVCEVDTHLALEVVRRDRVTFRIVVRYAVQRAGEGPRADGDQQRAPLVQVLAGNLLAGGDAVAPAQPSRIWSTS